ncbi:MAG: DUF6508 domain-containing protein [Bacteroidales bacterium]|nr:DUF6508 domain-containing protein [Bacteroidales bacterium]
MDSLSKPVIELLQEPNDYEHDIKLYCEILSFLPFFEDAVESDYITYHNNKHSFEYTPQFYSFIKALFDSKMVEDHEVMTEFLKKYNSKSAYSKWVKDMNIVLSNTELSEKINLAFIRKAFFTIIKLEKFMPGSWGIDVETGNWLNLLKLLRNIMPQIYKCNKSTMN